MNAPVAALHSPQLLADAFSEFISASATLEASYRDLQGEVAHLSVELAERNAELTRSLGENDRMRATLQQMIDSMPCGVLVLDAAESIVTINPEGHRLLGRESARAKTLRDLSEISHIDFEALVTAAEGQRNNEICLTATGKKRWLAIGRRELDGAPAARFQSIWILRDITADKLAEQERERARRATTLAEISTILAHEIRNPLASLELFAGLIADDRSKTEGETEQWIANLRAGIRTLSGTVNNVLSMNGDGLKRLAPMDLSRCVASGVEFVQPIAQQAGVELRFVPAASAVTVEGNEDAIRQIMLNLIANAIRHTPVGGTVDVAANADARHGATRGIVTVRDNGCGIPENLRTHIFEAGFSGTGETPGLGLAVCRRLMAQHHGGIRVESRVGEGTEFELEFPAI
jgi:two-component system sensor histidine kinase FlrB